MDITALSEWIIAPIALLLWIVVLMVARRLLLGGLRRVASRTSWQWDTILIDALSPALFIAILVVGLYLVGRYLSLSAELDRVLDVLLAAAIALTIVVFVDRLCRGTLDRVTPTSVMLQGARGLIQGIVRLLIGTIGLLIFLDSIGISITPLLASLGVGSLAVALALQDTLANLFAGIYMIVDKPVEAGHLVQMDGGEVGTVLKVGWRSTWLRTLPNNIIVVPNSKVAGSVIANYSVDDPHVSVYVDVGVHYGSDLERVDQVTRDVGREVMRSVEGGVPDWEPQIRFHTFGDSSVNLTVVLRAAEYRATFPVRSAFVKRLHARYRREGITIPFPIRTLDFPPGHLSGLREILAPPDAPGGGAGTPRPPVAGG
jgi:small-conductance mechanosensitive channel